MDIARVVGISPRAVSSALNGNGRVSEETRQRIKRLAKEMDYRPNIMARGLAAQRTYLMGVVVPYVSGSFYPEVLQGVEDRALQEDYRVVICSTGWDPQVEARQVADLIGRGVDGLVLVPCSQTSETYRELEASRIPYIQVFQPAPNLLGPAIRLLDEEGAYKATSHLIRLYATRPYHLPGLTHGRESDARLAGFKHALIESGYPFVDEQCVYPAAVITWEQGRQALLDLYRQRKVPRTIFAVNDYAALGAMRAASEVGLRVPQELAIVGYDDLDVSFMQASVKLTTVRQPKELVGQLAVQMLLDRIADKSVNSVELVPELVVRESCGAGMAGVALANIRR